MPHTNAFYYPGNNNKYINGILVLFEMAVMPFLCSGVWFSPNLSCHSIYKLGHIFADFLLNINTLKLQPYGSKC